jgi:protein tyrosine/serine phosphatase
MDYNRLLYKYHIATIVNVRWASEHRDENWYNEEITWVRNNGVGYIELPIARSHNRANYFPNQTTQKEFLKIMADKNNLPVLLHGSSGKKRVPLLAAVWMIKNQGYTLQQTIDTVDKINGEREVAKEERQFIEQLMD